MKELKCPKCGTTFVTDKAEDLIIRKLTHKNPTMQ